MVRVDEAKLVTAWLVRQLGALVGSHLYPSLEQNRLLSPHASPSRASSERPEMGQSSPWESVAVSAHADVEGAERSLSRPRGFTLSAAGGRKSSHDQQQVPRNDREVGSETAIHYHRVIIDRRRELRQKFCHRETVGK